MEKDNALEMEQKGHDFYKEVSEKSINKIARDTFSFLAQQEILHIESIRNYYNSIYKNKPIIMKFKDVSKERQDEQNIFSKKLKDFKEKISSNEGDKEACEFAMEFENTGYKYYEGMLKGVEDENLVSLLKFLLAEESKHFENLSGLHTYLTDSSNWYMYEEGSFPQGG